MPYNFPDTPSANMVIAGPNGTAYKWDSTKWTVSPGSAAYLPIVGGAISGVPGTLGVGTTPPSDALPGTIVSSIPFTLTGSGSTQLACNAYQAVAGTFKYIASGYATAYNTGSGNHAWFCAPSGTAGNTVPWTQTMALDASGNLQTSGYYHRFVGSTGNINASGGPLIYADTGSMLFKLGSSNTSWLFQNYAGTANAATLTGGGNLTIAGTLQINGSTFATSAATNIGGLCNAPSLNYTTGSGLIIETGGQPLVLNRNAGNGTAIAFYQGQTLLCGTITVTNGNAVQYNTSSDGRLKEDLRSFNAGPLIDALKVYDFAWRESGERGHGVIAQEAASVYPEAATYNEQNDCWMTDYSRFVPLLLAEMKALRARLSALEAV